MIPILNSKQINDVDLHTISNNNIKSFDLMERAASNCCEFIKKNVLRKNFENIIHIFCGVGNNGGDGLALARMLNQDGYIVNYIKFVLVIILQKIFY